MIITADDPSAPRELSGDRKGRENSLVPGFNNRVQAPDSRKRFPILILKVSSSSVSPPITASRA